MYVLDKKILYFSRVSKIMGTSFTQSRLKQSKTAFDRQNWASCCDRFETCLQNINGPSIQIWMKKYIPLGQFYWTLAWSKSERVRRSFALKISRIQTIGFVDRAAGILKYRSGISKIPIYKTNLVLLEN